MMFPDFHFNFTGGTVADPVVEHESGFVLRARKGVVPKQANEGRECTPAGAIGFDHTAAELIP